jgi:hypothetical protein
VLSLLQTNAFIDILPILPFFKIYAQKQTLITFILQQNRRDS